MLPTTYTTSNWIMVLLLLRKSLSLWMLSCLVSPTSAFAHPHPPQPTSSSVVPSPSFAGAAATESSVPVPSRRDECINLQAQHHVLSPAERMKQIASKCEDLGISDFDQYGDFQKGMFYIY